MNLASSTHKSFRLYGLDFIRIFCIFAIIQYHCNQFIFYVDSNPLLGAAPFYTAFDFFQRSLTTSGFIIVSLSFFLVGFRRLKIKNSAPLFGLLIVGQIFLSLSQNHRLDDAIIEWDIYLFLMLSFITTLPLSRYPAAIFGLFLAGFILLWIPFWSFLNPPFFTSSFFNVMIGDCSAGSTENNWPILPWIGLPWLSYGLGYFYHLPKIKSSISGAPKFLEIAIWSVLLVASLAFIGDYFQAPAGPGFNCFIFRQSPLVFWSHFIWFLFAVRLSTIGSVNSLLGKMRLTQFVSGLHWSKKFGRCYIIHLFFLAIGIRLQSLFYEYPVAFDIFMVSVFPLTEVFSRLWAQGMTFTKESLG